MKLSQPRNRFDPRFREIVDNIYSILTSRAAQSLENLKKLGAGVRQPLPGASAHAIEGLVERVAAAPFDGVAELSKIADPSRPHLDHVFAAAEALYMLELAELTDGELRLAPAGRIFAQSKTAERKRLFKEHLMNFVPLAAHVAGVLNEREEHRAPRVRFKSELEDHLSAEDAEATFRTLIDWGRYAELFAYDDKSRTFTLISEP